MLILRTLMRLEAHLALCCGVTTPSFPTKVDVEQLRLIYTSSSNNSGGGAVEPTVSASAGAGAGAAGGATPAAAGKKGAPLSVPASAGAPAVGATPSGKNCPVVRFHSEIIHTHFRFCAQYISPHVQTQGRLGQARRRPREARWC